MKKSFLEAVRKSRLLDYNKRQLEDQKCWNYFPICEIITWNAITVVGSDIYFQMLFSLDFIFHAFPRQNYSGFFLLPKVQFYLECGECFLPKLTSIVLQSIEIIFLKVHRLMKALNPSLTTSLTEYFSKKRYYIVTRQFWKY